MPALRFVLMLLIAVLNMATSARATIHEGVGLAYQWDFSDSARSTSDWDILYVVVDPAPPYPCTTVWFDTNSPAVIMLSGVAYEDVLEAPTDPGLYWFGHCFIDDGVYVLRTREGHYAKLKMVDNFTFTSKFYYVYQDDGSPYFYDDHPLAVETTTWGRVKALFQANQ